MIDPNLEKLFSYIRRLPEQLETYRELLLANLVMLSEIPSPTFHEQERIAFLEQRFTECGLDNCSTDETGNGFGILPGTDGKETILVTAHADTSFSKKEDHNCRLDANEVRGPGVAENTLGLAVLATIPTILEGIGISFRNDLILMGATKSLERGNQGGLRFFLSNKNRPLSWAISLEGIPLGRLQFRSMASLGGIISCHVNSRIAKLSAIDVLSKIIARLHEIRFLENSNSVLVLGGISGGVSYKVPARRGSLKFQFRSHSDAVVLEVAREIDEILDEVSQKPGISAFWEVIARTRSGGLDSSHSLVTLTRRVMNTLNIYPYADTFSSVISGYVEHSVPAICIGITEGENVSYSDEYIVIDPIMKGIAQLIGILMIIDGGYCAEH